MDLSRLFANRGHHQGDPLLENSIEAVRSAASHGLGGVKLDVVIVDRKAVLHGSTHQMGEHLMGVSMAEARHMTGRRMPTLADLMASRPSIPVILELHQAALVTIAADVLSELPDDWIVASRDHRAVLECAEEYGCRGMLMVSHRPLPGTMPSMPHRCIDAMGWASWPTWPDEIDLAQAAGWTNYLWGGVLPEDRISTEMSHADYVIADLNVGWNDSITVNLHPGLNG